MVGSGFPDCLSFFIGLQTQLNFAECFTLNPNIEGQKCMMESFSVKFSGRLQFSCKAKKAEKKAKKLMINLHALKL